MLKRILPSRVVWGCQEWQNEKPARPLELLGWFGLDLSITAANVAAGASATHKSGTAGATITAGQVLYLDSTDSLYKLADNNVSAATADAQGIALHGSLNGQPIKLIAEGDNFVPGATLVVGETYCLSETPGGIQPIADITTGERVVVLGVATSTTVLKMKIFNPVVVHA